MSQKTGHSRRKALSIGRSVFQGTYNKRLYLFKSAGLETKDFLVCNNPPDFLEGFVLKNPRTEVDKLGISCTELGENHCPDQGLSLCFTYCFLLIFITILCLSNVSSSIL